VCGRVGRVGRSIVVGLDFGGWASAEAVHEPVVVVPGHSGRGGLFEVSQGVVSGPCRNGAPTTTPTASAAPTPPGHPHVKDHVRLDIDSRCSVFAAVEHFEVHTGTTELSLSSDAVLHYGARYLCSAAGPSLGIQASSRWSRHRAIAASRAGDLSTPTP
jgi:hypothetical protein